MEYRKKMLCPLFFCLWLTIFLLLTPIMLLVSGRSIPKAYFDIANGPFDVHYSIDSITFNDNLFRDVEITGWSFIENDAINEDKEVLLLFVSDKDTYQVRLDVFDRGDLPSALPNLTVPRHNSGFLGSFSPIALKNGVYRLYIYNKESQQLYGIADTNRSFFIQNGKFIEVSDNKQ